MRIDEIRFTYEDHGYRTPIKFGGVVLDRVTLLNVRCRVSSRAGKSAWGFGSMPLGNVWAFPTKQMPYETTLAAMKAVVERIAGVMGQCQEFGHPIDVTHLLEPEFHKAAGQVGQQLQLSEPVPPLATLVRADPFDAALHDAFGKVHGLNVYHTYGRDFLPHDLDHYLGPAYRGLHLADFIDREPRPTMPLYHLVGALDPLEEGDVVRRLNDGLPETLPEWIAADGLTHLKIKLNGDDLAWDVLDRVARVERVTAAAQQLATRL